LNDARFRNAPRASGQTTRPMRAGIFFNTARCAITHEQASAPRAAANDPNRLGGKVLISGKRNIR
jgi:hypothetical protein